jgi:hypothetical protein
VSRCRQRHLGLAMGNRVFMTITGDYADEPSTRTT